MNPAGFLDIHQQHFWTSTAAFLDIHSEISRDFWTSTKYLDIQNLLRGDILWTSRIFFMEAEDRRGPGDDFRDLDIHLISLQCHQLTLAGYRNPCDSTRRRIPTTDETKSTPPHLRGRYARSSWVIRESFTCRRTFGASIIACRAACVAHSFADLTSTPDDPSSTVNTG